MPAAFSLTKLFLAFGLAGLIAWLAWRAGALDGSGAGAATLLGGLVYGIGGIPWAILLIAFFTSSSMLSRSFQSRKKLLEEHYAKGGRRDWAQVAANGGAGAIFLGAAALDFIPVNWAWLAFAASLATVSADTWATELGMLSLKPPRLISTWAAVTQGTSGGITLTGSLAALTGATLIAVLAAWLGPLSSWMAAAGLVALAGLLGSFVDSTLGATVQAMYYCLHCERETERHPLHHCGTKTELRRGWAWLNNDWVNFLSSLFAAGVALLIAIGAGVVG